MANPSIKYIFIVSVFALLTSCGNKTSSGSSSKKSDKYSPAVPVLLLGDVYANQWYDLDYDGASLITTKPAGPTYSYSISGAPAWLNINAADGRLTGFPTTDNGVYEGITITATDTGTLATYDRTFSLAVLGDPLRRYSWHLKNTGQKAFASLSADSSTDINVLNVYNSEGVTGEGVRIAISDSGGEINHDDLYQNVIAGANKDYTRSNWSGYPTPSSAHGTAVAGLIAAKGWNNIGSMGVAPNAKFGIFQFLDSPQNTDILIDQASGNFHIFNYSYGDTLLYDTTSSGDYVDFLRYQVLNARSGLGPIYLKAAGNEYTLGASGVCGSHNANAPLENEAPWLMVIGAVNANGDKASYSNAGSNIWVSAPGGEYGDARPALITTDLPTCFKGYSKATSGLNNSFEYGHSLNEKCNYTSIMNGTSGATPIVAGVVALMLEANPNLTWRDVKHILAMTANNTIDSATTSYPHPSNYYSNCTHYNFDNHTYEHGWTTNAASRKFHNHFGFGVVDAAAAVALAKDFSGDPLGWLPLPFFVELNNGFTDTNYRNATAVAIPDATLAGDGDYIVGSTTSTINVASSIKVETVQIKVNVSHGRSGQIGLELTSPAGTKSIMLNVNNSFLIEGDSNLNMVLASQAFYGETANGTWTLKVIDGQPGYAGQLNNWHINIIGHN